MEEVKKKQKKKKIFFSVLLFLSLNIKTALYVFDGNS